MNTIVKLAKKILNNSFLEKRNQIVVRPATEKMSAG